MACATLKRSLDWESLNQRPTKRRRCNPFTTTSGTAQISNAQTTSAKLTEPTQSAFADTTLTKLTPGTCYYFVFINHSSSLKCFLCLIHVYNVMCAFHCVFFFVFI